VNELSDRPIFKSHRAVEKSIYVLKRRYFNISNEKPSKKSIHIRMNVLGEDVIIQKLVVTEYSRVNE
jgi:hypothetical protein